MIDLTEYDLTNSDSAEFRDLVSQGRPPTSPVPLIAAAVAALTGIMALFLKAR